MCIIRDMVFCGNIEFLFIQINGWISNLRFRFFLIKIYFNGLYRNYENQYFVKYIIVVDFWKCSFFYESKRVYGIWVLIKIAFFFNKSFSDVHWLTAWICSWCPQRLTSIIIFNRIDRFSHELTKKNELMYSIWGANCLLCFQMK